MSKLKFGHYDYAAFFSFSSYATCSLVVPMCLVALAADLKFPLQENGMGLGGAIQLGRSIPMTLTLILCGFFAARWGSRVSLGVAMLLVSLGTVCAGAAPAYGFLFAAIAIAGLGEGIIEGLATPFVHDLHTVDPGRYVNFSHSFWSVGVLTAVALCGVLLSVGVSWRWLALGFGLLALIPAGMFLLPVKTPYHEKPAVGMSSVGKHTLALVKTPRFWLFFGAMFFAGGGEFCLTFWSPSFIQLVHNASAWAAGLGLALFALGMLSSRMASGFFVPENRLGPLVLGCSLGAALLSLPIPTISSCWVLYLFLFLTGFMTGPLWATIQSYCVQRVRGESTLIFIILSASGIPGCGVFSVLTGVLGDHLGLSLAFYAAPASFLAVALLLGIERLVKQSERGNDH